MPGKTRSERKLMVQAVKASMRPQRNAGENGLSGELMIHASLRFNEAPAKCRGKPRAAGPSLTDRISLQ